MSSSGAASLAGKLGSRLRGGSAPCCTATAAATACALPSESVTTSGIDKLTLPLSSTADGLRRAATTAHFGQALGDHIGPYREVRSQKAAAKMQPDGRALVQIYHDRARIAAQRGGVVLDALATDARHAARREALEIVNVAENF